jgi:phage shock protein PspC (stress-responsive transcriptional regulator)
MKKTISVNIGGILFYIEEDGYELLKAYLESAHQRFQHQPEAKQSFDSIESRVAEIFLDKLSENKAFISLEDVKQLLVALGESSDFQETFTQTKTQKQTNPQNHFKFEQAYSSAFKEWETKEHTNPPIQEPILPKEEFTPKRLFRDTSRKLIGGVASGISYYFEIDPLLIRLVFLITLVDLFTDSNNDFPFIVIAAVIYGVMWAFIPANGQLPENLKIRRFFRDPDDRILGGISSGFAHYFGIETIIIRFLFVISALLGFGLLMYPILWLITPLSHQPLNEIYDDKNRINLADIEKKIKELFSQKDDETEKKIVSVVLYPIRLLSQFSTNFPSAAKQSVTGLFYFIFAMVGISFITISSIVSVALLSLTAMYFSTKIYEDITPFFITLDGFEGVRFETSKLLWDSIKLTVPPQTVIYTLFTIWTPFIVIGIMGASILQRRWVAPTSVNWSLLIVWIIGIIGTIVTVPMAAVEYQAEGSYKNTYSYLPSSKAIYFDVNDNSNEHFMNVELQIRGHEKENIEVVQHFFSQGKSRSQAVDYAKSVLYNVQFGDSIITFDRNIQLVDGTPFRGQRLKMKLLVPYNKPFHLSERMASILRNTLTPHGYTVAELEDDNVWMFDENGLRCVSCDSEETLANIKKKKVIQTQLERFNKLSVEGNYTINIVHGKSYEIKAICGTDMGEINMQNSDGELIIGVANSEEDVFINLIIQTPTIKEIELNGKIRAKLVGFDESRFKVTLLDSAYLEANINTDKMTAELSDFSKLVLNGKTELLKLHLTGTSEVSAEAYPSEKIEVVAEDLSKANVNASEAITVVSYGNSLVNYIGDPQKISVTKNDE